MNREARELELIALGRLGLASRLVVPRPIGPDEQLLVALVAQGALGRHQAVIVQSYIARHKVSCRCGASALAPESARRFACLACGASLEREESSGTWSPIQAPPAIGVGSRIGPLELVATIGKGAHGTVYRGRHLQLGRASAVKIVPADVLDERKRVRFQREIAALGRLDHPNIVRVHGSYEVDGNLACEMELASGETLADRLRKVGSLPWRDAAALVAKLARAMAHAHEAGVLHRDLKPANLILRSPGGEPLIVDFGLSRFVDQVSSFTAEGSIVGTPVYMAPEAFSGESGPSLDVYGLGAILYHALEGRAPFEEASLTALYFKVQSGLCPPTAAPGAPPSLERVRARAMAIDPARRYRSAEELARDLERVLAGHEIEALEVPRRGLVAGVAGAIVVLVLGVILLLPGATKRPPVERALETLGSGETGRADALAVLVSATRLDSPGHGFLTGNLDAAIARAPSAWELRLVRTLLTRQRAGPILAEDYAALSSASDAAVDLVAGHALTVGFDGQGGAAAAHRVWLAHKDVRSAAVLFGLAASGGDVSRRADVLLALRAGRNDPDRARRLTQALNDAEDLAALLRSQSPETAAPGLARRLADNVPALAREGTLPASPGFILAPLGPAGRSAWHHVLYADAIRWPPRREVLALLDGLEDLPPDLVATREIFRAVDPEREVEPHATVEVLDAAAMAMRDEDPLAAAALLEVAATGGTKRKTERTKPTLEWAIGRYEVALEAIADHNRRVRNPSGTERFWALQLGHRIAQSLGISYEALASLVPPEQRRANLEKAVAPRRMAFELARDETFLGHFLVKSAKPLVKLLFGLGRFSECEPCVEFVGAHATCEALRAEILRRAGKAREAAVIAARAGPTAEPLAVLALAEADLGQKEDARAHLARLVSCEIAGDVPFLEEWSSERVTESLSRGR